LLTAYELLICTVDLSRVNSLPFQLFQKSFGKPKATMMCPGCNSKMRVWPSVRLAAEQAIVNVCEWGHVWTSNVRAWSTQLPV